MSAAEDLTWAVEDQIKQLTAAGLDESAARQRLTADITRLSRFYLLDAERTGTKLKISGRELLASVFWGERLYHEDVVVIGTEERAEAAGGSEPGQPLPPVAPAVGNLATDIVETGSICDEA